MRPPPRSRLGQFWHELVRLEQEAVESVRIAFVQIGVNKMRSMLTALGVVIGVLAVTLMGTAIRGIDTGFDQSMAMFGDDILYVEKWPWGGADEWWKIRNRPDLEVSQALQINTMIEEAGDSSLLLAVPTMPRGLSAKRNSETMEGVFTISTNAEFALLTTSTFAEGRFFSESEDRTGRAVVVLGYEVAQTLFPEGNPIGKEVRVGGRIDCEVIGVFEKQGSFLGLFSFDNQMVIPLTVMQRISRRSPNTTIRVKVREGADKDLAIEELTGYMRRIRQLEADEENDFEVNRTEALEGELGPIKNGIAAAGLVITSLSLFVGAIGIMNITFVSVRERTREIGTRRALGARRRSILMQFLVEAVAICIVGGSLGIAVAFGMAEGVKLAFPAFPVEVSTQLVLTGLFVSIGVGVLAGFAPAWQASRLDPATALRHE